MHNKPVFQSFDSMKIDNLKILEEIKTTINKNVGSLPVYCNTDKLEDEIIF